MSKLSLNQKTSKDITRDKMIIVLLKVMVDHVSVKCKYVLFIGLLFIMQMVSMYETVLARLIFSQHC